MRTFNAVAFALSLGHALAAQCNADNCARAVTGSAAGLPTRQADCRSFQACTVTPATSTATLTVTITPGAVTTTVVATDIVSVTTTILAAVPPPAKRNGNIAGSEVPLHANIRISDVLPNFHGNSNNAKRQATTSGANGAVTVCPTAVPRYASACSGTVRYASACSCGGITKSTTTVSAPVTTSTVTVTEATPVVTIPETVTTTLVAVVTKTPPPPTNFIIKASESSFGILQASTDFQILALETSEPSDATVFTRNGTSTTLYTSDLANVADTDGGSDPSLFFLDPPDFQSAVGFPLISCSLGLFDNAEGGYAFTCQGAGRPVLQVDSSNRFILASSLQDGNVVAPALFAVPV